MKTRIGKIAQLSNETRDELNHRLQNGKLSPEILKWLNALPETQELLAERFDHQPITKSNLSDWRQGGYQDWLRLQRREERIQRITESGETLEQSEGNGDLFENFARLVIAELAADLDSLTEAKNQSERWQRLRELSRELARLQNGYNRSRWAELAWTKWNDRSYEDAPPTEPETQNPQLETKDTHHAPRTTPPTPVVPNRTQSHSPRFLHHAPCGCICRKCHSEDSPHPYWDAERDAAAQRKSRTGLIQRENGELLNLQTWNCDCTCPCCDAKNKPEPENSARKSVLRTILTTKCECHGLCHKCHAPDAEYPLLEVLQDQQWIHENHSSIRRSEKGISTCFRTSFCNCSCDECEQKASDGAPELPPGFGVRQPSAALWDATKAQGALSPKTHHSPHFQTTKKLTANLT